MEPLHSQDKTVAKLSNLGLRKFNDELAVL